MMEKAGIVHERDSGGKVGEFTVWVDDKLICKKRYLHFPDKEEILKLVQQNL